MKPTTEQTMQWAREAGATKFVFSDKTPADQMHIVGKGLFEKLAALAYSAGAAAMKERFENKQLWLWRNGDHYLAFEHLYPCYSPGGDPMTLGEPAAVAFFRGSHDRELRDEALDNLNRAAENNGEEL